MGQTPDLTVLHYLTSIVSVMEHHAKEAHLRLNYLYQAAHCVLAQNPENVELARFYCHTQKTIARRLVIRQDPSVKRTQCKKCCSLLIPGVTATTRQIRQNGKTRFTVVTCLSCGKSRKFLNNPDHTLWVDRPEAQMTDPGPYRKKKNKPNPKARPESVPAAESTASPKPQPPSADSQM